MFTQGALLVRGTGVLRKEFTFAFWCFLWGTFYITLGTGKDLLGPKEKYLDTYLSLK